MSKIVSGFCFSIVTLSVLSLEAKPTIVIDGSSTVFPISEGIAEEFQIQQPQYRVAVASSGTGGGFKKFCKGEVDLVGASRPIEATEIDLCAKASIEFIELPIAYDGIVLVVNKNNSWTKNLTTAELKKIWEPGSSVRNWKDVRPEFPDLKLSLYGPGPDSGTFDYFTKVINGKEKASRSDYSASESDFVIVRGVAGDKGGLGYFGFAYYDSNQSKLNVMTIEADQGPVLPSMTSIASGAYRPLSRPLFVYVSKRSLQRPEVKSLSQFFIQNAEVISAEVGYVGLGKTVYQQVLARLEDGVSGSIFRLSGLENQSSVAEVLSGSKAK
jgi:phosphate transport system substrate-binding protein